MLRECPKASSLVGEPHCRKLRQLRSKAHSLQLRGLGGCGQRSSRRIAAATHLAHWIHHLHHRLHHRRIAHHLLRHCRKWVGRRSLATCRRLHGAAKQGCQRVRRDGSCRDRWGRRCRSICLCLLGVWAGCLRRRRRGGRSSWRYGCRRCCALWRQQLLRKSHHCLHLCRVAHHLLHHVERGSTGIPGSRSRARSSTHSTHSTHSSKSTHAHGP
mmetsp:Transcript_29709/g.55624  ORF Transcript_29709/g.55624 Transcript_29709/m.55624 type:complete len:214 (+) Transcript_29709:146-787(+)